MKKSFLKKLKQAAAAVLSAAMGEGCRALDME